MSRNEVKSLNDLAMSHGGQLTINPQTGLPEAGFLSMILPMVAGAALGPAGLGLTAMQAGLAVGAGSYLLNPKAGLMGALSSGFGGYGGAGLGAGLEKLGSNVTSETGLTSTGAATDYATQNAQAIENAKMAEQARLAREAEALKYSDYGPRGEFTGASAPLPTSAPPSKFNIPGWSQESIQNYLAKGQPTDLSPYDIDWLSRNGGGVEGGYSTKWGGPLQGAKYIGADLEQFTNQQPANSLLAKPLTGAQLPPPSNLSGFDAVKEGISKVMADPSKLKDVGGGSWTGLASMGLAAAAPAANLKSTGLNVPTTQQKAQVVPHYRFTPGMATPTPAASATGVENTYFPGSRYEALSNEEAQQLYPGYPDYAKTAANGGIMGYAGGGPVEQMSNAATLGENTMYPMANMTTSAFATPYQDPKSTNMLAPTIAPSGGGTVNMMSGEPNMQGTRLAGGGISGSGNLDLSIPLDFGGAGGGGFGGGGANGYSAVGSGGGSQTPFSGSNNTGSNGLGINAARDPGYQQIQQLNGNGPEMDTFQGHAMGTGAFSGATDSLKGLAAMYAGRQMATGGMAMGGFSDARYNLGGYSDGGRLLRGPGDGVSDSIPATIGHKQPARLADGEFVVPARIVSELGNGSTEAGARKLYAMMDRVQASRKNTVGKGKVAKNNRADKYLPA